MLFVIPRAREDGFRASIRGHMFDLVDPSSTNEPAPTDDLFVVSHASELAWSARAFLRTHGLPDRVDVVAAWQLPAGRPAVNELHLTVMVSGRAEEWHVALAALLEERLAARSLTQQVVHIEFERAPKRRADHRGLSASHGP